MGNMKEPVSGMSFVGVDTASAVAMCCVFCMYLRPK